MRKFWKHRYKAKIRKRTVDGLYECACGAVLTEQEVEEHKEICTEVQEEESDD